MKILYRNNPLYTSVFLNNAETLLLKERFKYERLCEALYEVMHRDKLKEKKLGVKPTFEEILEDINDWADKSVPMYIKALQEERHDGDCIYQSCSCAKCYAEKLMKVNTIDGLSKKDALYLTKYSNDVKIDDILNDLKDKEKPELVKWLEKYKEKVNE